ncbi:PilN domain-containing protein [Janthinobacterium lividum]|uniref:PilN domain-containing protein n=1 Tax=Janthinobacterium lividum TaxID=29581 RepID=UPI00087472F3|nr:PilN domain-containing protein [Janthinobacterium lividum]MCC7715562.1 PilN domain-containing protein [Janthinobacterium lividum]OEZ52141.1 fimbrial assembly protein (PilN) [Janthinobacterium lividum]WQE29478.1 PilN domain-containing protein [Janthinobacterium lividum]STQ94957.1 Fimbrial assembly protein (PilN) [Janthinobacterium lividum]
MTVRVQVQRINLLPYRPAARRRRIQLLLGQLAGGALLGLLLALATGAWQRHELDAQLRRQEGWRSAMQQVDAVLATSKRVQGETAALLLRQQAIASLQEQRNAWVRMLDVLTRAMPAGVALHSVRQEAAMVRLQGQAASQDKVAALLLALEQAAPWSRPELVEVRLEVRGAADGAVEWTVRLALAPSPGG